MSLLKLRGPLTEYLSTACPSTRAKIEAELWKAHGRAGAVMVLDMAGFSITTRERGIIHYLAMVSKMQRTVQPLILEHHGQIVKFESDNCFAYFTDVPDAIAAANAIQQAFTVLNRAAPDELDILVACGIDYGEFLLIDKDEFYGDPVNCACKLGEDLAEAGETLVSRRAMDRMKDEGNRPETIGFGISQIEIEASRLA